MAAKRNIPEAWKNQWSKFMFNFFDYLPTKYEANKREWSIRRMIWDFKDGKRSASVAELVAKKMREQFGIKTKLDYEFGLRMSGEFCVYDLIAVFTQE